MTLTYRGHTQQLCPSCNGNLRAAKECESCHGEGYEYVEANVLLDIPALVRGLDRKAVEVHAANIRAGWWTDIETGADLLETRNRGEMLMLCVTELDEARDARLLGSFDDKLPHLPGFQVELADCAIRLFDLIGAEQRRGGQQPLIVHHSDHGMASVAREYQSVVQCLYGDDLMWIVGALSKALDEGYRKENVRVARYWLATALFRIIALAVRFDIPLFDIIEEKMAYNRNRADHKIENRRKRGGKKC